MTHNVEQTYQARILKVLIHIQNHLDDALSLDDLAAIAFFSPFHFHRIFTALTGESIQSYVRRLRLQRATRDLAFTDLSIIKISERAGYDTQQSFHRAFKELYHKTPKSFRNTTHEEIAAFIQHKTIETQSIPVEVKTIDPIKVVFARHIGPYEEIVQTWFELIAEVGLEHIFSENTMKIGIPYDSHETTPSDKLRYDACVTFDALPNFKAKGKIGSQTLHGGKYAVITHHGAIETIESTYRVLFGVWLPQSGYEPADHPNFMHHRKLPFETAAESLVTDIYLPLR